MKRPKRDPHTGQFLPKSPRRAALRTAASSVGRALRGNPKRKTRKTARKAAPKQRKTRKTALKAARKSFWGW